MSAAIALPPLTDILAQGRGGEPFEERIADEIRERYARSQETGEDRLTEWLRGVQDGFNPHDAGQAATGGGGHMEEDRMATAGAAKGRGGRAEAVHRPRATTVNATPRPRPQGFKFRGELKSVTVESAKIRDVPNGIGEKARRELQGGALVVSIRIEKPQAPKAPVKQHVSAPYNLQYLNHDYVRDPGEPPPPFEEPEREEGETDAALKKRTDRARKDSERDHAHWTGMKGAWERLQAWKQEQEDRYQAALAKWREECEALGPALEEYARLAAAGAVYGGIPFDVTLAPNAAAVRSFLPGLGAPTSQPQLEQGAAHEDGEDGSYRDVEDE